MAQIEADPQTNITRYPRRTDDVRRRLYKRALMRNMYLMLKHLNGIEFALLKRRHFGTRCTCYEPISRTVLRSRCPVCYGTSWVGGYFNPVQILGRIVHGATSEIQSDLSPQGKDDISSAQIQVMDFPKVDEGDVLVAKHLNRRFLVQRRFNTSLKTVIVHQTLTTSELARVAPEFAIEVGI